MVSANLLHLFLKERIYVLPEDRPKPAEVQALPVAQPVVPQPTAASPSGLKSVPKAPQTAPNPFALPKIPQKGLVVLVHNPAGSLTLELTAMLGKLATATEPMAELHVHLVGDMALYPWPQAWNPWPAKLTLLLGWPPDLLARYRVAEPFRALRFGPAAVIAAPHPADLEADRSLKAQLWSTIQSVKQA